MTPSPAQDHSRTEGLRESIARVIEPVVFRQIDTQAGFPPESLEVYQNRCVRDAFAKADQILALLTPSQSHDEEDARPESPSGLAPSEHEAGRSAVGAGGFTPGPWLHHQPWSGFSKITGPGGVLIFGLAAGGEDEKRPDAECAANARLIAAAPDLLEALQAFNLTAGSIISGNADSLVLRVRVAVIQQAAAAVAKALGREDPK